MSYELSNFEAYSRELQPYKTGNTFSYNDTLYDLMCQVEEAAQRELSGLKNAENSMVYGLPGRFLCGDSKYNHIQFEDFVLLHSTGILQPGRLVSVVLDHLYSSNTGFTGNSVITGTQNSIIESESVSSEKLRLYWLMAAVIKCQIAAESEDCVQALHVSDLLSDFFDTKATLSAAIYNRGLLILTIPTAVASNKMLPQLVNDIVLSRHGKHSTMLIMEQSPTISSMLKSEYSGEGKSTKMDYSSLTDMGAACLALVCQRAEMILLNNIDKNKNKNTIDYSINMLAHRSRLIRCSIGDNAKDGTN